MHPLTTFAQLKRHGVHFQTIVFSWVDLLKQMNAGTQNNCEAEILFNLPVL